MGINETLQKSREPVDIQAMNTAVIDQLVSSFGGPTLGGVVDAGNTTTTPLSGDAVFTGTGVEVTGYASIIVSVTADAPGATDGVEFQFSTDNATWKTTDNYTYTNDGACKTWALQTVAPYFRLVYTNGAAAQTAFNLCTQLKENAGVTSSHRVADNIEGQDDAALTKTVLAARRQGDIDEYQNITSTPDGELRVSVVSPMGTLPVSQLTTLHDGKIINRDLTSIIETVGTGTGLFANNTYGMSVTAGQYLIRQTRRFAPYFSGKPQKIELTFDNFAPQANVIKRVGYYSSSTASPYSATLDGVWLESGNGTIRLVASNAGTETISIDIADWDNYSILGTYQTLSTWNNFTVIELNFLWLGGAYLELKLMTPSGWVIATQYIYAGRQAGVFIKSPNQPVRYEIRSTTGAGSMTYVCNQVATAGSINESAISRGVDTGSTAFSLSTSGVKYPVIALRKGATFRDNMVVINSLDIFIASSDEGIWSLEINPTLSAALTYTAVPQSSAEKANGTGAITVTSAGIPIIASGTLTQGQAIPVGLFSRNFMAYLSGSITGVQDQYVLCFTPSTTNASVRASINYSEG